jgi:hypothetical protein
MSLIPSQAWWREPSTTGLARADPGQRTGHFRLRVGDAGLGLAIFGTGLAVAGILASAMPEQASEWLPLCFEGENGKAQSRRVRRNRAGRRFGRELAQKPGDLRRNLG